MQAHGRQGPTPDTSPALPLAGVRVLELGHIVAAPSGGLILADLGADLIKVEHPRGGDQARAMPGGGLTFFTYNRNKRSIAIDLKSDRGRSLFLALVRTADVVLDNYAPGTLDSLGIGYEAGAAVNPRVIYCAVKGFLPGPAGHRPFLDELAQVMGGLAYMTGPLGQPLRAGASIIDIGAATYGVVAILCALVQRERTGRGQSVQSGLFETTAFWVAQHVVQASATGQTPLPMPSRGMGARLGWGVYRLFTTADERQVFIAVISEAHWRPLCALLGLDDLAADPSLSSNAGRVEQRERVHPRIEAAVAQWTAEALMARLEAVGVPYAPLNTPTDLLAEPQLRETARLYGFEVADGRQVELPGLPIASSAYTMGVRRRPPLLGEQTTEVLRELGLDEAEIAALLAEGTVGTPATAQGEPA